MISEEHAKIHRELQCPGRLFSWLGPITEDEIVPVFTFDGPNLTCSLGAQLSLHVSQELADAAAGAGLRTQHRCPVLMVGSVGKRRFTGMIPVQVIDYQEAHLGSIKTTHCRFPRFDNFNRPLRRVWLRDCSPNKERPQSLVAGWTPTLALLVVTPQLFPGKCEMKIVPNDNVLELARGQVANDTVKIPTLIRAGISAKFHETAIGLGRHGIFLVRLHRGPLLSVSWKAKSERQNLEIQGDLTVLIPQKHADTEAT